MITETQITELFFFSLRALVIIFNLFFLGVAFLGFRQVSVMNRQVKTENGPLITTISFINLIVVLVVFIMSVIVLFF